MLIEFLLGIISLLLLIFLGPVSVPAGLVVYFAIVRHGKVAEDNLEVLIVGAGISGITLAKSLNDIGVSKYTILEQSNGIGGTWLWNKYPGCCCDVPAEKYSFSWHYNPAWSKRYPGADELQEYISDAASVHKITSHIKFNKTVDRCEWNEDDGKWKVDTSDGATYYANVLVNATGILHIPVTPNFEGDQNFEGVKMHTARWDKSVDLIGKEVGLIGTGCSGVQVLPSIINDCKKLTLFQRTPAWVFPKGEQDYDGIKTYTTIKFLKDLLERLRIYKDLDWGWQKTTTKNRWYSEGEKTMQIIQAMMESVVEDSSTRKNIIPSHGAGVKRMTFSDDYLQAFNKNNFKLVTDPITKMTKEGIETKNGENINLDILVYATGFDTMKSAMPFEVIGRNGQNLRMFWGKSPRAYKGICVPKMPNYFIMFGPSTIHDRMLMSERAGIFVADAVHKLSRSGKKSMVIKEDLYAEYNKNLKEAVKTKTWNKTAGGYYQDGEGFNWLLYPYSLLYYVWQTWRCSSREFDWN